MTNEELAAVFDELALLSEVLGESPFKVRAYERAAETLRRMRQEAGELHAAGRLREVPGFGEAIAKKIGELVETGSLGKLEELRAKVPAGVLELLRVPSLGPKTAWLLYEKLGVDSLEALGRALEDGSVGKLPRFGPKKVAALREGLASVRRYVGLHPFSHVISAAERAAEALSDVADRTGLAGDARRGVEAVEGGLLIAASDDPARVIEAFSSLPDLQVAATSPTSAEASAWEVPLRLEVVRPAEFFRRLWEATGSPAHVAAVLERAGGRLPAEPQSEEEIYAAVDLAYVPPELREGKGEIDAASKGELPRLVRLEDIRGDLHVHSDWSDGRDSVGDMLAGAAALGYEYLAIADHSQSVRVAGGFGGARKKEQIEVLRAMKATPCRVLVGTEVDILPGGSLDYDDDLLARLDVVVASVHSHFSMSRDEMTARICRAMENPHVDAIGHPTGRVLLQRDAYDVDVDELIAKAAETGTALELNAMERFDLSAEGCRKAKAAGVIIAISSDAHGVGMLSAMRFGVTVARRAGLSKEDVLNARPLEDLMSYLRTPKSRRRAGR